MVAREFSRTETIFDVPLNGVIGGLHFPVTDSRMPYGVERVIGAGKLPWRFVSRGDLQATVDHLRDTEPAPVGISPYDSCDRRVVPFKEASGERCQGAAVEREIIA